MGNRRVLVTGATGFIGGRIVERLIFERNKGEIIALVRDLSRVSRISRFSGVNIVKGDVLDLNNLIHISKNSDLIFHCAYGNRGDETFRSKVTVEGTRNVCEAALRNRNKLVYLSTVSVYGDSPPELVDENTRFGGSNDAYTKSKITAEQIVWGYIKKRALVGTIIRPTIVYGPHSPVWTLNPINQLREKRLLLIDQGNGLCNHLYVDNLVDALFLASLSDKAQGEAYIISDGSTVSWKEFHSHYKSMLDELGIENDWISLSREELLDLIKGKKSLSYNVKGIVKTSLTNEDFNKELEQYPLITAVKGLAKRILPAEATEMVRELRQSYKSSGGGQSVSSKLDPPSKRDVNFFSSKSIFSIRKAQRDLGYKPRVGLREGMELIKEWYCTLF